MYCEQIGFPFRDSSRVKVLSDGTDAGLISGFPVIQEVGNSYLSINSQSTRSFDELPYVPPAFLDKWIIAAIDVLAI